MTHKLCVITGIFGHEFHIFSRLFETFLAEMSRNFTDITDIRFSRINESPSKKLDIKTPLVVSFTLGVVFFIFVTSGVSMSTFFEGLPLCCVVKIHMHFPVPLYDLFTVIYIKPPPEYPRIFFLAN